MKTDDRKPRYFLSSAADIDRREMPDGGHIRTYVSHVNGARANILLLSGRTDFLEKWADIFATFENNGFSVASWDWRGQGGSSRMCETGVGHIDSFDHWLSDLDELALDALAARGDELPWFVLGHSMGGHLAMRWLADPLRREHRLRQRIRACVLTAPLFGISLPWPLSVAAPRIARYYAGRGRGEDFAWGQKPFGVKPRGRREQGRLTASLERFQDEELWIARNPALATGGVSWQWLTSCYQSMENIANMPLDQLDIPFLVLLAARERIVRNVATRKIMARVPDAKVHMMDGAHELMRESDRVRAQVFDRIFDFLNGQMA